jgi:hypothetical protein
LLSTDETDADKVQDGDEPLLRRHWEIQAIGAHRIVTLVHRQNAADHFDQPGSMTFTVLYHH